MVHGLLSENKIHESMPCHVGELQTMTAMRIIRGNSIVHLLECNCYVLIARVCVVYSIQYGTYKELYNITDPVI